MAVEPVLKDSVSRLGARGIPLDDFVKRALRVEHHHRHRPGNFDTCFIEQRARNRLGIGCQRFEAEALGQAPRGIDG